jgi:hypothetical protein
LGLIFYRTARLSWFHGRLVKCKHAKGPFD